MFKTDGKSSARGFKALICIEESFRAHRKFFFNPNGSIQVPA